MRTGSIYGLCEPDGELRYVGQTLNAPARRRAAHVRSSRSGSLRLNRWVRQLLDRGAGPALWILEDEIPEEDLNDREVAWIAACRAWGVRLINLTEGGRGGGKSDETREKIGASRRGVPRSPETRARISEATKEAMARPDVRARYLEGLSRRNHGGVQR